MKVLASLLFSPVGGGAVIGGASWGRSISLDRGGFRDEASHRSSVSGVYKAKKKERLAFPFSSYHSILTNPGHSGFQLSADLRAAGALSVPGRSIRQSCVVNNGRNITDSVTLQDEWHADLP